jgi:putative transposase
VKRKRFSVEQIVAVLKQAELGTSVADLVGQVGISEQTFYRWKKQYAGMQSDQVREHQCKKMARPAVKRHAVEYVIDHYPIARRRACRIVGQHRSVQYYRSRRDPKTALRARMRELAQTRIRYG